MRIPQIVDTRQYHQTLKVHKPRRFMFISEYQTSNKSHKLFLAITDFNSNLLLLEFSKTSKIHHNRNSNINQT